MVLQRQQYEVVCERVIDGDTIKVYFVCPLCDCHSSIRLRLARIDAPEFDVGNDCAAEASRALLASRIEGQRVTMVPKLAWPDKYGRIVAEVIHDGVNLSNLLVDRRAAVWWP